MKTINNLEGGLFPSQNLFEQESFVPNGSSVDLLDPEDEGSSNKEEPKSTDGFDSERLMNGSKSDFEKSSSGEQKHIVNETSEELPEQNPKLEVIIPKQTNLHPEFQLPIDALPDAIQQVCNTVTEVYQCPRDFILSTIFMATSTMIGKRIKCFDGKYTNTPSLWLLIVAKSGSNKSAPIKHLLMPLTEYNMEMIKSSKREMSEWQSSEKTTKKPAQKQLIIIDSTPEARHKCLHENPNGALLSRDEFSGFMEEVGRYTKSGELTELLSIFDNTSIIVNRKSEDVMFIDKPLLNILGGIQPDVIPSVLGTPNLRNNGFLQRFLFCNPDEQLAAYYSDATVPEEIDIKWLDFFKSLIEKREHEKEIVLTFSPEAMSLYKAYYNMTVDKINQADGYMSAVYSKLLIYVQRWALITAIIRDEDKQSKISSISMDYAIRCMDYFERCAQKVYDKLSQPTKLFSTGELVRALNEKFGIKNYTKFAESLGMTQQSISKILRASK